VTALVQFLLIFHLCRAPQFSLGPELNRPDPIWPVQQDPWIAEDKFKHMFTSMAAVHFAYGAVRLTGMKDDAAVIAAVTSGAAAGIWKEFHDRRAGRPFSGRDLLWDGLGLGAGLVFISQVR
jgi:uncharacterized protein YfiM (DUF2279 family)